MAVPAMTQRKAGSVKAGDDIGADAEGGAVRPKDMLRSGRPSNRRARVEVKWKDGEWALCGWGCEKGRGGSQPQVRRRSLA